MFFNSPFSYEENIEKSVEGFSRLFHTGFSPSSKSSNQATTSTQTTTTTTNSNNTYVNSNDVGLEGNDLANFLATVSNISTNSETQLGAVAAQLAATQGNLVNYSGSGANTDSTSADSVLSSLSSSEKIALVGGGVALLAFIVSRK